MHRGAAYIIANIILVGFWMAAANIVLESRYPKLRTWLMECAVQDHFPHKLHPVCTGGI